ncbi:thiosulfate oxidation carrier protein SoxY [Alicycliphilus sp. T452]|jgi:sulfur-oxidizing protein SoxY
MTSRTTSRRQALQQGLAVAGMLMAAGVLPRTAFAYNKDAFDAKSVADVLKALGAGAPAESKDVTITGPDIAENGAVVPLGAATTLAGVKQLLLLVEKNPNTLVAAFNVTDAVEPNFLTRAKLGQSSDVYAVAITNDGKAFYAKKEVKVTLGGCGG